MQLLIVKIFGHYKKNKSSPLFWPIHLVSALQMFGWNTANMRYLKMSVLLIGPDTINCLSTGPPQFLFVFISWEFFTSICQNIWNAVLPFEGNCNKTAETNLNFVQCYLKQGGTRVRIRTNINLIWWLWAERCIIYNIWGQKTIFVHQLEVQIKLDNSKLGSTQEQKICWHWHVAGSYPHRKYMVCMLWSII